MLSFKEFVREEIKHIEVLDMISELDLSSIKTSDISYKPGKLKIPRKDMPQVKSEDFHELLRFFKKDNIKVTKGLEKLSSIVPIQKNIVKDKVIKLIKSNTDKLRKPLLISKDNYLIDGHHRYAALKFLEPDNTVGVIRIDLPVEEALKEIKRFPKTFSKNMRNHEPTS